MSAKSTSHNDSVCAIMSSYAIPLCLHIFPVLHCIVSIYIYIYIKSSMHDRAILFRYLCGYSLQTCLAFPSLMSCNPWRVLGFAAQVLLLQLVCIQVLSTWIQQELNRPFLLCLCTYMYTVFNMSIIITIILYGCVCSHAHSHAS